MTAPKNNVEEGKAKMSLLPMDILREYLVPAYEEGVLKYSRESWRQGFRVSVMMDAAIRHIEEFYWKGEDIDPSSPTGKHHLAGAIFSLLSILHTLKNFPDLDDRWSVPTTDPPSAPNPFRCPHYSFKFSQCLYSETDPQPCMVSKGEDCPHQ